MHYLVLIFIQTHDLHVFLRVFDAEEKQSIIPNENVLHAPCTKSKSNEPTFCNAQLVTLLIYNIIQK